MNAHRILTVLLLGGSLLSAGARAEEKSAVAEGAAAVKKTGKTIGHTTRDVTREIGHATRDAAKEVGHATRNVVKDIKKGFKSED